MVRPSLRVTAYIHCFYDILSFEGKSLEREFYRVFFSSPLSLLSPSFFHSSFSYKRRRELQLRKDKMSNPLSHGFGSPNKAAHLPGAVLLTSAG